MNIVIVGAGEVGFHLASRLSSENKNVVVIDRNAQSLEKVADSMDVLTLLGSGSDPATLKKAGVGDADILLAVTDSDEVNLVACLAADLLSKKTRKLARLRNPSFETYHDFFRRFPPHIDKIINPEVEVVKNILALLTVPGAVDYGEFVDGRIKLLGVGLDKASPMMNRSLMDLPDIVGKGQMLVVAVIREQRLIIPRGHDVLRVGDVVYFVSEEQHLHQHLGAFVKNRRSIRHVMIMGGGRIGMRLASELEKIHLHTKLVEKERERCLELASTLPKTVIIHGDGSDQDLLQEENVDAMDAVVTLTSDEQTNIMASLLARSLGVDKTITRVNRFSYISLMSAIGIHRVVSSRLSAINSILAYLRKGEVLSAMAIKGEQGEVLETMALATSSFVGRALKNLHLPGGSLVIGIQRKDQVIIPSGDTVIHAGDRMFLFAQTTAIPKLERLLTVKLERV